MATKSVSQAKKAQPTSRDKRIAQQKLAQIAASESSATQVLELKIQESIKKLGELETQISAATDKYQKSGTEADLTSLNALKNQRSTYSSQLVNSQIELQRIRSAQGSSADRLVKAAADLVKSTAVGSYDSSGKGASGTLYYNASAVKEAYFRNSANYKARVQDHTNTPGAVQHADELWNNVRDSKGMIVTSEQVLKAWNSGSNGVSTGNFFDNHNYGFQFQYNPGAVSMSYFTSPNVDVSMITSGTEMFNLSGVSGSQGSIGFQVIINRMMDMQYYNSDGSLRGDLRDNPYVIPPTTTEEYRDLYEHGTMYDVEYLLRVLMGTTMNSYLRGERTADMGWLPAIPVELHLGNNLRYLGTINSINLNHAIFDSRMVPVFTTLDINFARLPDYPPTNTGATSANNSNAWPRGFRA